MPDWVDSAFNDYWRRMRALWKLELIELQTASRRDVGGGALAAKNAEARRLLELLPPRDFIVALDEHGTQKSTIELSLWLEQRRASGKDLAFIVGGPDGLAEEVLAPGGAFVGKVFQGGAEGVLLARIKKAFSEVKHVKPPASRSESVELYLVATGFRG